MGLSTFLGKIVGAGVGGLAKDVADVVDMFVETDEEKKAAEVLLMKIQQEPDKWQAEINKIEAAHRTVFVAGWRPFIGWICGIGIFCHFIAFPIAVWTSNMLDKNVAMPNIQTGELMTLVLSLLGLGALRSYEKKNDLAK